MMPGIESLPLLSILVLMISAFLMPLIQSNRWVKAMSLLAMLLAFVLNVATLAWTQAQGGFFYRIGHFDAPVGIEFRVGQLESLLGAVFTLIALAVLFQASQQIDQDVHPGKVPLFFLLSHILVASLLGIMFANDLFNVYVFIEIGNLASCGLVVIKDTRASIKAGLKYLIMSTLGSGLVLLGIAWIYTMTGHLNMTAIHNVLAQSQAQYPRALLLTLALFTIGLGVKSAIFPLHSWLPDAHASAPAPASALLSSLVLKGYIVFLLHLFYRLIGYELISQTVVLNVLLTLGSAGLIAGSLFALYQQHIKKVIAYSSVAQMGYVFLAIGLGSETGLVLAVYHIIGHALTKAMLFLSAGTLIRNTGETSIASFKGIGQKMPVTLAMFTLGSLSLIGIPVLPGFISKWYLALASLETGRPLLVFLILLSGLLNAVYLLPVTINGFFHEPIPDGGKDWRRERWPGDIVAISLLAAAVVWAGIASQTLLNLIQTGLA